jgi:Cft2 family RNA processing exonuclease
MEETSLKFTSFLGGKEGLSQAQGSEQFILSGAGAYCSLLEIGETRLLLDCGCLSSFEEGKIDQLRQEILTALNGKLLDAILITHAGITC